MNEPTLTAELARGILAGIRAGGFPHVAAAAYGVDLALWERWLRRGRSRHAREPYRTFVRKVEEAQAQARLRAEIAVLEKDTRGWLKHGPGRDLPGRPGWAALVRPAPPPPKQAVNWLASPEFARSAALLQGALALYPEALAAATHALDGAAPPARE
jgi:hypothetical protein